MFHNTNEADSIPLLCNRICECDLRNRWLWKRTCVNDPRYECTDCGCSPCVDEHDVCWSCAGEDARCYPYDCGSYCSTLPCSTVDAVPKTVGNRLIKRNSSYLQVFDHRKADIVA